MGSLNPFLSNSETLKDQMKRGTDVTGTNLTLSLRTSGLPILFVRDPIFPALQCSVSLSRKPLAIVCLGLDFFSI